ncbi:MAG: cobyric acid synthase [Nitrospinota bacterium]
MTARTIMIQGTGSDVGKSLIVTALCRIFLQDGHRVAPFKSQNMALNSFVTADGGEMGRAQVVQAGACRIDPEVVMNPVLLKPTSNIGSQVIVMGRVVGNMSAEGYMEYKGDLIGVINDSLNRLRSRYEIVVIEGAGSPAEINLKNRDIVNMRIAEMADAPVLLIGDIDRGGVFAWLKGTLDLLDEDERARIKGLIINKFRGDKEILRPGLEFLEEETGMKVIGVIPYCKDIRIMAEDSVCLTKTESNSACLSNRQEGDKIRIGVIRLPHISNFTDFDPLKIEPDVELYYIGSTGDMLDTDVVIIPGSKNTISDLRYIMSNGLSVAIKRSLQMGAIVIGICGGYQMLGKEIIDPYHIESDIDNIKGLGFLDIITKFGREKITHQIRAVHLESGIEVSGYEIHMGESQGGDRYAPLCRITRRGREDVEIMDGMINADGNIMGTYIHGLFDSDEFRRKFIDSIRMRKGIESCNDIQSHFDPDREYDRLADIVRGHLDMDAIYKNIFTF